MEHFELQRLPVAAESELFHVFSATKKSSAASWQALLASGAWHWNLFKEEAWAVRLENLLLDALHELENAKLAREAKAEGRVFLHLLALADFEATALYGLLEAFTSEFAARHGALLQGLWVDEIVIKAAPTERGRVGRRGPAGHGDHGVPAGATLPRHHGAGEVHELRRRLGAGGAALWPAASVARHLQRPGAGAGAGAGGAGAARPGAARRLHLRARVPGVVGGGAGEAVEFKAEEGAQDGAQGL